MLFSMVLAPFQALNFTGMGGPMGVYEPYDTDACDTGGTHCVARDNEAFYARPGRSERRKDKRAWRCTLPRIAVLQSPSFYPGSTASMLHAEAHEGFIGFLAGGKDGEGWDLQSLRPPDGGPHGVNGDRKVRKGGQPDAFCPAAFDCNGVAPPLYHPNNYL